jgi:hypothetical protein
MMILICGIDGQDAEEQSHIIPFGYEIYLSKPHVICDAQYQYRTTQGEACKIEEGALDPNEWWRRWWW